MIWVRHSSVFFLMKSVHRREIEIKNSKKFVLVHCIQFLCQKNIDLNHKNRVYLFHSHLFRDKTYLTGVSGNSAACILTLNIIRPR